MRKVYIAGPITKGDHMANIRNGIDAANRLRDLGFFPFVPHLSAFWHYVHPRPYEDWMELDFVWLVECDALLRLPGVSEGADREVAFALEHDIPVFIGVEELFVWSKEVQR
jgi:hypothetical protein